MVLMVVISKSLGKHCILKLSETFEKKKDIHGRKTLITNITRKMIKEEKRQKGLKDLENVPLKF